MNAREKLQQSRRENHGSLLPVGRPFTNLPLVTEMTFGLHGIFVFAGATKVGKTTAVAHLVAGALADDFHGVYYEHENGLACERVAMALGDDDDTRLDYLDYEQDFTKAVDHVRALTRPGFLVVDTIQGSLDIEDHDSRLDAGVLRGLERRTKLFTDLAREGHAVLVVSQINDRVGTAPPAVSAIKGASAIEQAATAIVAYGTPRGHGREVPVRELVLRLLRRPVHPSWPIGSRVGLRTDGQDRLTEEPAAAAAARAAAAAPKETIYQKVDRVMAADPATSAATLGRAVGLSKSRANFYQQSWRKTVLPGVLPGR